MRLLTRRGFILLTFVAGCGDQSIDEANEEISFTEASNGPTGSALSDASPDSSTPKIVTIDALTGAIVSIQSVANAQPAITISNPCASEAACWVAARAPYANFGFSGTGTASGTWLERGNFYTHHHSSSVCWTYRGSSPCSPTFGPNTAITFNGATVTGKRVTNHS